MVNCSSAEKMLKEYKVNKARIIFMENQIKRFEYDMIGNDSDMKRHSGVGEAGCAYGTGIDQRYAAAGIVAKKELEALKLLEGMVEDVLNTLNGMDSRYGTIIEEFYIRSIRMEDIAQKIHISRSKCYELCKEALSIMDRIVY